MNGTDFQPQRDDPNVLRVTPHVQIPHSEFQFSFSRSSGPGGQNVNKVNSKATLRWAPAESAALTDEVRTRILARCRRWINNEGELLVTSQRYRTQPRNVQDCLDKLREILAEALSTRKRRHPTRRTAGSNQRRLKAKKLRSQTKQDRRPPPRD